MRISELMKELERYKETFGDVEVYSRDCGYEKPIEDVGTTWYNGICVVLDDCEFEYE